jgi:hypothetical protein
VTTHAELPPAASLPLTFIILDNKSGAKVRTVDHFIGP